MNRDQVWAAVLDERARQFVQWGGVHPWGHGDCSSAGVSEVVKVAVLTEEVGEVARAVLDDNRGNLAAELVQVAAVVVAWLECL